MSNTSTTSSLQRKLSSGYEELQTHIPFRVPYNIIQENKTVDATTHVQHFYPSGGYDGVYDITVNPISDPNLIPENIVDGVTIFDVTGSAKNVVKLQPSIAVNPGLNEKIVEPNLGFDGIKKVIVNGLLDAEPNLKPINIRAGVSILGMIGEYDGSGSPYTGQTDMYAGDGTNTGISVGDLLVYDDKLIPSNIRSGVTIFNVTGEYSGEASNLQELKSVLDITDQEQKTISKDDTFDGMISCKVGLASSVASKILYPNKILGVTGSYKVKSTETVVTNSSTALDITPTASGGNTYSAMNKATVSLDNGLAQYILSTKKILGLQGTHKVQANRTITTDSTTSLEITPSDTYNSMTKATVTLNNSLAQYIAKDVWILGVKGTYEGGSTPDQPYQVYDLEWKNGYYSDFTIPSGVNFSDTSNSLNFSTTAASSGTYYMYLNYSIPVPSGYTKLSVTAYCSGSSGISGGSCSFGFSSTTSGVSSATYSTSFEFSTQSTRTISVSGRSSGYIVFKIVDALHVSKGLSVYTIEFLT